MEERRLRELIAGVRAGRVSEAEALEVLKDLPFADLGYAKVDHHRALRQGAAEVVFAPGKRAAELVAIVRELSRMGGEVLITRLSPAPARELKKRFRGAIYNQTGRTMRAPGRGKPKSGSDGPREERLTLILSGGTADLPVVEEARETLLWLQLPVQAISDVGVAGIHRLLSARKELARAAVIIVVAGMEGALASVVAGLVDKPVIGVPVSVGYGAGAGGLAALLGMLNSCAAGVVVMNIDNGFGAACAAARILRAGSA